MSYLQTSYINKTITAANDVHHKPPIPLEPSIEQRHCKLWVHCSNPYCFKHGCLNALRQQGQEGQS